MYNIFTGQYPFQAPTNTYQPLSPVDSNNSKLDDNLFSHGSPSHKSNPNSDDVHRSWSYRRKGLWRKRLFMIFSCVFFGFVISGVSYALVYRISGYQNNDHSKAHVASGNFGAAASEHPICSEIGISILKKNGNAVDAGIAVAICIGTLNCFSSGIGGGGFMLIRDSSGISELIDFRETAPSASYKEMFVKNSTWAQTTGLSIGVPGELRGFYMAFMKYGSGRFTNSSDSDIKWSDLFTPSINLARNGYLVTKVMAKTFVLEKDAILNSAALSSIFAPKGTLLKEGDTMFRKSYADTLESIANSNSPDIFYSGRIGKALIKTIRENDGIMTLDDLRNYKAKWRKPLIGYYQGHQIITGGAPTSGPILLSILNLIERYNFAKNDKLTSLNVHRLVEAFKFGYAQRTELGDPEFVDLEARIEEIISKDYANVVRKNISDDTTHEFKYYNPKFDTIESPGTTHISVVDKDDMAVSLTSTVNLYFGSKIMDIETGVILNNEMDDFSIPGKPNYFGLFPSPNNYVVGGKRPLSSTTPTIVVTDNRFAMAIGASGGSKILSNTVQAIVNVLDFNMDIQTAISAPRLHHQLLPDEVHLEKDYPSLLQKSLISRHHSISKNTGYLAVVQGVVRAPPLLDGSRGKVYGGADPRKGGQAFAY